LKILKTTIELAEDLREPIMIEVTRRKIQDPKYSLKKFINDAVREKLGRERKKE
jgi:hypothetical protein